MKSLIRVVGWLLFAVSTVFTLMGMLALGGMMQDPAALLGIELTSKNDRVLWVVVWLLGMLAGLWLAKPAGKREAPPADSLEQMRERKRVAGTPVDPQDTLDRRDADRR